MLSNFDYLQSLTLNMEIYDKFMGNQRIPRNVERLTICNAHGTRTEIANFLCRNNTRSNLSLLPNYSLL